MKKSFSSSYAVIGLGFGDEGKGVAVNSLCNDLYNVLVIRYSGGQQAGHTVTLKDGTSHVFSNFGSGTFQGAPTYWSKYCTFDPVGVINELNVLKPKTKKPILLYIDKQSPVTTPYDKLHNQRHHKNHGTCGVGVGATFAREEKFYSLLAGDILFPSVLEIKLRMIGSFYGFEVDKKEIEKFMAACEILRTSPHFRFTDAMPRGRFDNFVFESSQGLMLDQNIGFFPHVTRSNVGAKNIVEMGFNPETILVTRAFQTRHGNGPMTNSNIPHNIKENPKETNVLNRFQGEFKRSLLDLDLLKYAMQKDPYIRLHSKKLVITCLDLVKDEYRYTLNGHIVTHLDERSFVLGISTSLGIDPWNVASVSSPDTNTLWSSDIDGISKVL